MEGSLAEELYSETLRLSHVELDIASASNYKQSDLNDSIEDVWDDDDLDGEWQKTSKQFNTIGYREGLLAAKEASAQEGFNIGFKESVLDGYKLGVVRGVTSVVACLPDGIKVKLVETQEKRNKLQSLHESVHSLSTTDALKLFHDSILTRKTAQQSENADSSSDVPRLQDQSSECNLLGKYFGELQSLLRESPAIEVSLAIDQ